MATYIIGDIHGNLQALIKALNEIDIENKENKLIFAGDYGDYGKDGADTILYIMELDKTHDNVECIVGNHDLMLMNQIRCYNHTPNIKDVYYDKNFLYTNYGKDTFNGILDKPMNKQIELEKWIDNLRYRIDLTVEGIKYSIVHDMILPIVDRNDINFEHYRQLSVSSNDLKHLAQRAGIEESQKEFDDMLSRLNTDKIVCWHAPKLEDINIQNNILKLFNNRLIMIDCGIKFSVRNKGKDSKLLVLNLDTFKELYF